MAAMDADPDALVRFAAPGYRLRASHPFGEISGAAEVAERLWGPLHAALRGLRRMEHIFIAGENQHGPGEVWTLSHGVFQGTLAGDWLGIPATGGAVDLPFAEFHQIEGGRIAQSALFLDIVRLQQTAGLDPFPNQTGARMTPPGPAGGGGVVLGASDPAQGAATRALLDRMIEDIVAFNGEATQMPPPELLARTWHNDMAWFGPGGIGTARTIPGYQALHQRPFREALSHNHFHGHVCRIAEGSFSGWFGWPNLTNRNAGGYLGLPASDATRQMRVVDIYRRAGAKLAENWVFIDLLHYAHQHGVDLLAKPGALGGRQ